MQKSGSASDYPVPISLSPRLWLISDGQQELHLIDLANGSTTTPIATYEYVVPTELEVKPTLRLHTARLVDNGTVEAVVSHRVLLEQPNPTTGPSSGKTRSAYKTVFDIVGLSLSIPPHPTADVEPADVIWKRRGDSIPLLVEYDLERGAYLLVASTGFTITGEPKAGHMPSEDEIAPIPRAGENLDGETTTTTAPPPKPPPYSWTQTNDSVTVAFPVPSSTAASAIRVNISLKYLSLLVSAPEHPNFPVPRYLSKEWWGPIDASSSFWTWDKEGDRQKGDTGPQTVGLLTLHLEKKNEGTRWPHVFHSVGTGSTAPEDVEVPETIDPSEMWHIRESLEKYTAALSEGRDVSGMGLGTGVPSLGQGEYDEDVDANAGTPIHLTWVSADGQATKWDESAAWPSDAALLSRSLPVLELGISSLVLKNDIDGLLYEPPAQGSDAAHPGCRPWRHVATFSALAFVLASKQDLRYVFHVADRVVLAFEGGTRVADVGENVFIYRAPASRTARTAEQAVIRIGGSDVGGLIGVSGLEKEDGGIIILCLCEKQLVVLPNIA